MTPPAMHAERLAPVCFYLDRWMWLVSGLGERCQADIQMQCCPDVTAVTNNSSWFRRLGRLGRLGRSVGSADEWKRSFCPAFYRGLGRTAKFVQDRCED